MTSEKNIEMPDLAVLISEKEVLAYRPCLARGTLLAARKTGTITWTRGKRNSAWYRLSDVDLFLRTKEYPVRLDRPIDAGELPLTTRAAQESANKIMNSSKRTNSKST